MNKQEFDALITKNALLVENEFTCDICDQVVRTADWSRNKIDPNFKREKVTEACICTFTDEVYADKTICCSDCQYEFTFRGNQACHFAFHNLVEPKRCPKCRYEAKEENAGVAFEDAVRNSRNARKPIAGKAPALTKMDKISNVK
jgi:hypothetical protein